MKSPDEDNAKESKLPPCSVCGKPAGSCTTVPPMRKRNRGTYLRRRTYVCSGPEQHEYVTEERYAYGNPMLVLKNSGRLEPFDYDRLISGLEKAATPAYTSVQIDKLCREVTDYLFDVSKKITEYPEELRTRLNAGNGVGHPPRVIPSQAIGRNVLRLLKHQAQHVMWLRFALVFLRLDKEHDMMKILERLKAEWREDRG